MIGQRVRQVVKFGSVRRSGRIDALEPEVGVDVTSAEVRGKPVVHRVVEDLRELSKDELAAQLKGLACLIHGDCCADSLEVSAVEDLVPAMVDDGIIVG